MATQHPIETLKKKAAEAGLELRSAEFAKKMDEEDPLREFRDRFHIPKAEPHRPTDPEAVYLCGNSLGAMPKATQDIMNEEFTKWQLQGVEGHFNGARPWAEFDDFVGPATAKLVGAKTEEVCVMNSLTVNLHFLLCSFYKPKGKRTKIMREGDCFCSDAHAIDSQVMLHGLDPKEHVIKLNPRSDEGEATLRTEDIIDQINKHGDEIAVILIGGIQFYTGQLFEFKKIVDAGHAKGCLVGFDCAHAFANADMQLHDDGVDFACWCTYKYGNAGPGGPGGIFVHERHHKTPQKELVRLSGWWGQDVKDRFNMSLSHTLSQSAQGWACSNVPILSNVGLYASLQVFEDATMPRLRAKSKLLTAYLEHLVNERFPEVKQLTPKDPNQRGCQLSFLFDSNVKEVQTNLAKRGVIVDVRQPNVIRVGPTPLYNRFQDVQKFVDLLEEAIEAVGAGGPTKKKAKR